MNKIKLDQDSLFEGEGLFYRGHMFVRDFDGRIYEVITDTHNNQDATDFDVFSTYRTYLLNRKEKKKNKSSGYML